MEESDIKALHRETDKHAVRESAIRQQMQELTNELSRIHARIFEIAKFLRETGNDTTH